MGIRCYCPNGHRLNLKAFLAGRVGVCPHCQARFRIPTESEPKRGSSPDVPETGETSQPEQGSSMPASLNEQAFDAAASQTAVSQSAAGPVAQQPVAQQPVAQQPVAQQPVAQQPVAQQPIAQQQAMPHPSPAPAAMPAPADPIAEAPDSVWYVRPPSGGEYGPAKGDVMRRWIDEGRVTPDSLVWREGWPEWQVAKSQFPSL